MSTHDVDGLNAGYARALLGEYLENPEAVPSEWRALFESGDSELVASHPGIARLLGALPQPANGTGTGIGNGTPAATVPPPEASPAQATAQAAPAPAAAEPPDAEPDAQLLGGVAAAMALIKAHRTHGHLAAR
nr:hypothetical protein [Actinomycetota bacterium]